LQFKLVPFKSPHLPSRRSFALISLSRGHEDPKQEWKDKEVTLYIKGFLSRAEEVDHFEHWLHSHNQLGKTNHAWGKRAHGYTWDAGSLNMLPLATIVNTAWSIYKKGRLAMIFTPQTLAVIGAQELILSAGRIYLQYQYAQENIEKLAPQLAEKLKHLREHYDFVRVVAHSMGCRLFLEALTHLPLEQRPNEVHLCAPAVCEDEVGYQLSNMANGKSYLYYCERDFLLKSIYPVFHKNKPAVGAIGLNKQYSGLDIVDVDSYFGNVVHFNYKRNFSNFAVNCKEQNVQRPSITSTRVDSLY